MRAVKHIEFLQIAADWNSITLGAESPQALLAIRNGLATRQDQDKGDYKVSRIETIGRGWIDETRVRYASDVPEKDVEKYRIQKGDILFSHINSDSHLGKTGYADRDFTDLLHGMNLLLIRANPEVFEPEFLNRVFQYYRDIGVFISICSRSVNQSSINQARLKAVEVPLPPLPEQKKIAHILLTVQQAIEAQERIIQTTTELKKALMHKLFTEGLRGEPQKQTEIGLVPESWDVVELGEVAKIERGKFSHRPRNEPRFYGGEYPFVQTGDVSNCDGYIRSYTQTLNEAGLAISKMFPAGTILITIAANIGFTGILDFDSACPDSLIGISPNENVQTDFLNYYLVTQQPEMDRLAPKGTQKNINIQFLKPWPVPLPSFEEQREIAEAFSATDRKIKLATQKRSQLQDLLRTLLHELMTGKTRIHTADIK
jgi:type I restriction enzyme S subunit